MSLRASQAPSDSQRVLTDLCERYPLWSLAIKIKGHAGINFTKSYVLERHRQELTMAIRTEPPPVIGHEAISTNRLVIGLGIPATDDIPLFDSGDGRLDRGVWDPQRAVSIHWPFGAELLRRANALCDNVDIRRRLRQSAPDPVHVWRERTRLETAMYAGENIRTEWRNLQREVLAAYGLNDLPVGKRAACSGRANHLPPPRLLRACPCAQ